MRRLRQLLWVLLLSATLLIAWKAWQLYVSPLFKARTAAAMEGEATRVYLLQPDQPLNFRLEPRRQRIRLLSNGNLPDLAAGTSLDNAHYGLRYRVLDGAGNTLLEHVYHHRLNVGWWQRDADLLPRRRLVEQPALTPSDTNAIYLDLAAHPSARRLEVGLATASVAMHSVSLRAYYRERVDPGELDRRWQRLHATQRAELARFNVYDPDLLQPYERRNLMRFRWRPLVPTGVEGDSFVTDYLIDRSETLEPPAIAETTLPPNLASPGRNLTIPLPDRRNRLRLSFSSRGDTPIAAEDITVQWLGRTLADQSLHRPVATGRTAELEMTVGRGLLEITSAIPVFVTAVDRATGDLLEPRYSIVRLYALGEQAIQYRLRRSGADATPLRLDVRARMPARPGTPQRLRYRWLDRSGKILRQETLHVPLVLSRHDTLGVDSGDAPVSLPGSWYLVAPSDADTLEIEGAAGLYVAAYNRPADLVHYVEIPESLFGGERASAPRPPWFVLRPERHAELRAGQGSALLRSQLHPPERPQDVAEADRDAERLLPHGRWQGRHLLVPRTEGLPVSPHARSTTFQLLDNGTQQWVHLVDDDSDGSIRPTILYAQDKDQPRRLTLALGNTTLLEAPIRGHSGRLRLPTLKEGVHRLGVSVAEDIRYYINHVDGNRSLYRKQAVFQLEEKLDFSFERPEAHQESLSIRLYAPGPGRVQLALSVTPFRRDPGTYETWSFDQGRFDILLEPEAPARMLDTLGSELDHQGYAFHGLGVDVPPGSYGLSVRRLAGPPELYLSLNRFSADPSRRRSFRIQSLAVRP